MPTADTFLNAGKFTIFGSRRLSGTDDIEVDVDHTSNDGGIIQEGLAFEAGFPKMAFDVVFFVGGARDVFIELLHEPAEAAEAATEDSDTLWAIDEG